MLQGKLKTTKTIRCFACGQIIGRGYECTKPHYLNNLLPVCDNHYAQIKIKGCIKLQVFPQFKKYKVLFSDGTTKMLPIGATFPLK
jgi:hypothetical protein